MGCGGVWLGGMPGGQSTVAQDFSEVLFIFLRFKHTYRMFKVFIYRFYYMVTNKYYLITIRAGL